MGAPMKQTSIQRLAACAAILGALTGCATRAPQIYMWESFPPQQYNALLGEGVSPDAQLQVLQGHVEKARGANALLPPGLRAHMGKLHLEKGDAGNARASWLAEKAAFPESAPYMDQLIERLNGSQNPAAPAGKGNTP